MNFDTPILYPASLNIKDKDQVIVEVGPGRGDFLFHIAGENPDFLVVGIEIKPKRVDKLISRIEKRLLKNVLIIQDDARRALPRFFEEKSVDTIYINFPDPWPKRRHGKHRAVSFEFFRECYRVLKTGGIVSIATDHMPYAKEISENAAKIKGIKSCYPETILLDLPDAFPTFFAMKWKEEGRHLTYQKYSREF